MADIYSPIVKDFTAKGYTSWTKIRAVRTDPNPSANFVQIDWFLEAGTWSNGTTITKPAETCAWIKGFRNSSDSYQDEKESSVAYGKKWTVRLAEGQNAPGTPSAGNFAIDACCRVEAVADASNFLLVTTHNYIEVLSGTISYSVVQTSRSQIVRFRVRKI